jgi:hypothetical protein
VHNFKGAINTCDSSSESLTCMSEILVARVHVLLWYAALQASAFELIPSPARQLQLTRHWRVLSTVHCVMALTALVAPYTRSSKNIVQSALAAHQALACLSTAT